MPVLATMVVEYVAETTGLKIAELGLAALGVAAAGAAAVATKMAGDFEQGITRLKTGAGDTTDNMTTLSKGILATSVATGVLTNGTNGLNAAMYLIISSGQRGAQALDTLKVAAQGAQIEQASVTEVANTLSGVMTNYGTKTFSATQYMNGLVAAVKQGKITLEDLAVSMGPIDPIAHDLGISFNDAAAAMTTQTNAMIPAARAATGLRFMMLALENPTDKAKDAMKAMGLDSVKLANEMKVSLPGALQMVYDAAKKAGPEGSVPFNRAAADMVGGMRSLSTFAALTGSHMADFSKNSAFILDAMKQNKNAVEGWETAQSNFNIKMDQAKAAVAAVAIQLGTMLLPVFGQVLGAVTPAITAFGNWATSGHAVSDMLTFFHQHAQILIPVLSGLGAILLAVVVPAIWSLATGVIVATWPFIALGLAVAGLVAILMQFYNTDAGFKAFVDNMVVGLKQAWTVVSTNFIPAMQQLGNIIKTNVMPVLAQIVPAMEQFGTIIQTKVFPILQQIGGFLVSVFKPVWDQLVTTVKTQIIPAFQEMTPILQPLGMLLGAIAMIVGTLLVIALSVLVGLIKGVVAAFAALLTGIIQAIGGIVQMAMGFVAIISGIVAFVVDLFTGNWSNLGNDLMAIWNGILNMLGGFGNVFMGIVGGLCLAVAGFFWGLVTGIIDFFVHLFDVLVGHSIIPDMVNGIVSWFAQLPGRAMSAISSMAGSIGSFFSGIATSALQWGSNIVNNIAAGIRNAVGAVTSAVTSVAQAIANFLPHSPAKVGPLMGLEQSGTEISNQISKGMVNGAPLINSAIGNLTKPISLGLKGSSSAGTPLQGGNQQDNSVHIYLDGKEMNKQMMKRTVKELRREGLRK